ncbi:MAG: hypothetical protein KGZ58_00010 [Ignavibacteriales bacterium]|nr:hypothetical protein [Ignavibacteriales bacterium]
MSQRNFLPTTDAQLNFWLNNFAAKIGGFATELNITPEQVTQFETDKTNLATRLDDVQTKKTAYKSAVAVKDDVRDAIVKRIRDAAVVIKRHTNYAVSMGEDLGIVPPEIPGIPGGTENAMPEFQAVELPDRIRLDWVKDIFDGVIIQCKRGNETTFTTLGTDTISPFEDMRANLSIGVPEIRYYRMRYLLKDEEVGQWSDEKKVVCTVDARA